MASISTLRASSSTSNCDSYDYDVFLSFRGEDTRNNFTDHLYANLVAHGIHTFRDEELEKGGHIASELSRAIEESKIFLIVFSKNYADSKWCLNELAKIIDCVTVKKSTVLPVFYHVEPTNVRNQKGSFEDAFLYHAKDADQEKEKTIQTWKNALKKAASLKGYHLDNQSEAEFVQKIREDIIIILNRKPLHVGENIVGMDFYLEQLKPLIKTELDEVHMVGICGIGGIGKTTISMAIYNDIFSQFDGSSFLRNVGGKCEDGLLELQKTLLRDILKGKRLKFSNISEGINVIKERLRSKKVLVILDNVDNYTQLENLARKHGWYGAKSLIIITTRDKHLLEQHEVKEVYEVQKLDLVKSIELFNWWAFKQNTPKPNFESLADSIVKYCDGLPIALKVLGGFLFKRGIEEWNSALDQLKKIPNGEVQKVLKISYDKLDDMKKEMFLDIACFFRGKDKDFVSRILGSYAEIGTKVLHDSCLITIFENKVDMHDLLQQMGQEIVRQECIKEPEKRSRLWNPNDVDRVLRRNTGTEAIEGLFLDMSRSREISFTTEAFKRMERLRLFKVYWSFGFANHMGMEYRKLLIHEDFEFPSHDLSYLHWEGYPLKSLPSNFDGGNLIELNFKHSNLEHLWQKEKRLENLKVLNVSSSLQLIDMPCFSNMPNLEELNIRHCGSLDKISSSIHFLRKLTLLDLSECRLIKSLPSTIQCLTSLKSLYLDGSAIQELPFSICHLTLLCRLSARNCNNLRSLPSNICKLKSLEYLNLNGCSSLVTFPEIMEDMECLKELSLNRIGIKELPSSIEFLHHLNYLDLYGCKNLRSLPSSICRLKFLRSLGISGCSNLETFPEIMEDMECLKWLSLDGTGIKEFSLSIEFLNHLTTLRLKGCKNLRSLPNSIYRLKFLKSLNLSGSSNLETFSEIMANMECLRKLNLNGTGIKELPSSIEFLHQLHFLNLGGCKNLRSLPSSIGRLTSLKDLNLSGCPNLVIEDMENLPSDLWCLSSLVRLDLSQNNMRHIPAAIIQLCNLICLKISHCKMLEEIPELPSSLGDIDAHDCSISNPSTLLWSSLLKWVKKFESRPYGNITIGSNGIPGWALHQGMGNQIRIELPMNWHEDDHFFGLGFFCIYEPSMTLDFYLQSNEEYGPLDEKCHYRVQHNHFCGCYDACDRTNGSESDQVWLLYCPKIVIWDTSHSNQYMHLQASFNNSNYFPLKRIKRCGVHPIYSHDHQQNHIWSFDFLCTQDDESYHMPMSLN